jgi:hypothetical protein
MDGPGSRARKFRAADACRLPLPRTTRRNFPARKSCRAKKVQEEIRRPRAHTRIQKEKGKALANFAGMLWHHAGNAEEGSMGKLFPWAMALILAWICKSMLRRIGREILPEHSDKCTGGNAFSEQALYEGVRTLGSYRAVMAGICCFSARPTRRRAKPHQESGARPRLGT